MSSNAPSAPTRLTQAIGHLEAHPTKHGHELRYSLRVSDQLRERL